MLVQNNYEKHRIFWKVMLDVHNKNNPDLISILLTVHLVNEIFEFCLH